MFQPFLNVNQTSEAIAFVGNTRGDLKKLHVGYEEHGSNFKRKCYRCYINKRMYILQDPSVRMADVNYLQHHLEYIFIDGLLVYLLIGMNATLLQQLMKLAERNYNNVHDI